MKFLAALLALSISTTALAASESNIIRISAPIATGQAVEPPPEVNPSRFTITVGVGNASQTCSVTRKGYSSTEVCNSKTFHPGSASTASVQVGQVTGILRRAMVYSNGSMIVDFENEGAMQSVGPAAITVIFGDYTFTANKAIAKDNTGTSVIRYISKESHYSSLLSAMLAGDTYAVEIITPSRYFHPVRPGWVLRVAGRGESHVNIHINECRPVAFGIST